MSFLSQGRDTYKVPLSLFADNRKKLVDRLLAEEDNITVVPIGSLIYIQGGPSPTRYDTDHEPVFRQESYMWWLTGVKEPDVSVVLEVAPSCHTTLLIPNLPPDYATIMGRIRSRDEWISLYQVDQVLFTEELEAMLEERLGSPSATNEDGEEKKLDAAATSTPTTKKLLLLLQGTNSDSGLTYQPPTIPNTKLQIQGKVDTSLLFPILAECRVIKSHAELELLKAVAQVSSYAHAYVMRNTKPGMMEYQCESLFHFYSYYNYGCRLVSYTSICACGPNAAVLHYGHAGEPNNTRQLKETDGCLLDMGAEYQGYASDITCSFPANGKFSDSYRPIYEAVLQAQIAVYNLAQPGVSWVDCHKAAEREILLALQRIGIVILPEKTKDDGTTEPVTTIDDLVEQRLGAVFMPHGLGHLIGIDTHDVGGYLPGHPERSPLPGLQSLRTSRMLQENMVLTVEPGCYFIDHLLDEIFNYSADGGSTHPLAPYLNATELQKYRGTGGVRLEDMVAITKDGCVNFTCCPRTVSEVEHVMARGMWPPTKDEAPELRRIHLTKPIPLGSPLPSPPSN